MARAPALVRLTAGEAEATVSPLQGGVLATLVVRGQDLLLPPTDAWQPFPRWGSFVMAPWVGPLAGGRLPFRGQMYGVPPNEGRHAVHGLVAGVPWDLEHATPQAVELTRSLDGLWPFGGLLRQHLELDPAGITLEIRLYAGDLAMPVCVGWHPWFRRALGPTRVRVEARRVLRHAAELPTGEVEPVDADTDLRAAPILGDRRIDAVYVDAVSPLTLSVDNIELSIAFDAAIRTAVVFTPPEAVCVEPWSAWPDAANLAERGFVTGLVELEPGEVFSRTTRWAWAG